MNIANSIFSSFIKSFSSSYKSVPWVRKCNHLKYFKLIYKYKKFIY